MAKVDVRKKLPGPSVKQFVRSLRSFYHAATSPFTEGKMGCKVSHQNNSISRKKVNAGVDLPFLTPSGKPMTRSPVEEGQSPFTVAKRSTDHRDSPSFLHPEQPILPQVAHRPDGFILNTHPWVISLEEDGPAKDSKLRALEKQIASKNSCTVLAHSNKHSQQIVNGKRARWLSQVLGVEHELGDLNNHFDFDFQPNQNQSFIKSEDQEVDRIRKAVYMLKHLCIKQGEEIQVLNAALPATLKETAQLREVCGRQERELAKAQVTIPSLQEQVVSLSEQLKALAHDLAKIKAENGTKSVSAEPRSLKDDESELSSGCSGSTITFEEPQTSAEDQNFPYMNTNGSSIVPFIEKPQSWNATKNDFTIDKDLMQVLQELNFVANEEQAVLQEKGSNVFKDLRSSPSRLKSMLICSTQIRNTHKNKRNEISKRVKEMGIDTWNLRPT